MGQFSVTKIAAALVAFMFLGADAFVTPSAAFTGMSVSSRSRAGATTARAAGAMRSRPTMNVIDVSEREVGLWGCCGFRLCRVRVARCVANLCVSHVAV